MMKSISEHGILSAMSPELVSILLSSFLNSNIWHCSVYVIGFWLLFGEPNAPRTQKSVAFHTFSFRAWHSDWIPCFSPCMLHVSISSSLFLLNLTALKLDFCPVICVTMITNKSDFLEKSLFFQFLISYWNQFTSLAILNWVFKVVSYV